MPEIPILLQPKPLSRPRRSPVSELARQFYESGHFNPLQRQTDDEDTSQGKKRQRRARQHEPRKATLDDGESAGPLLSPEELAAIREATRAPARGIAMIVAERANAQQQWRESLIGTGAEFEIVANFHQLLTVCRLRVVESIVVDADACSAGGLTLLAAIRGQSGVPLRRVPAAATGAAWEVARTLQPERGLKGGETE